MNGKESNGKRNDLRFSVECGVWNVEESKFEIVTLKTECADTLSPSTPSSHHLQSVFAVDDKKLQGKSLHNWQP